MDDDDDDDDDYDEEDDKDFPNGWYFGSEPKSEEQANEELI